MEIGDTGELEIPQTVVEQIDALAVAKNKDRGEILDEALTTYVNEKVEDDEVRQRVVDAYNEDRISFEQLKSIVGVEAAGDYQAHKRKMVDEVLTNGKPRTNGETEE